MFAKSKKLSPFTTILCQDEPFTIQLFNRPDLFHVIAVPNAVIVIVPSYCIAFRINMTSIISDRYVTQHGQFDAFSL